MGFSLGRVGIFLLVVGSLAFAFGSNMAAAYSCVQGTSLSLSPVSDETESNGEIVEFDDLTPVEQRIFLEGYTDRNKLSDIYGNWSSEWFGDDSYYGAVVYRGTTYSIERSPTVCGLPPGTFLRPGGLALLLVGSAIVVSRAIVPSND